MRDVNDVVAVVPDLFFQSRILSVARSCGRQVSFAAKSDEVDFKLALVDLDAPQSIETISALRLSSRAPIIAFGPNVDTEKRKAARVAGADRVLAKSKLVTELPRLLGGNLPQDRAGAPR